MRNPPISCLSKLPEGYLEGTIGCVILAELTETGLRFISTHRIALTLP